VSSPRSQSASVGSIQMGGVAVLGRCCWLLLQDASPAQSVRHTDVSMVAGAPGTSCWCCSCVWQIVGLFAVCSFLCRGGDWVRLLHLGVGCIFIYALVSRSCK
jgi:hypothetical protein